jgi:hypothetical protein
MAKKRIKISAAYNDFSKIVDSLKSFDEKNQENFQNRILSKKQLHFLTESVFFNGFREYENFVRDIFLLYTQEKKNSNNDKVTSYIKPIDFFHAEKLIQSSMSIIDWNNPETIIKRSELFLKDGFPIKTPYTTNKTKLNDYRRLRNHIAHNSTKSLEEYKKVLRGYFGVNPLNIPNVGEYLLLTSKVNSYNYNLLDFFELLKNMADNLK